MSSTRARPKDAAPRVGSLCLSSGSMLEGAALHALPTLAARPKQGAVCGAPGQARTALGAQAVDSAMSRGVDGLEIEEHVAPSCQATPLRRATSAHTRRNPELRRKLSAATSPIGHPRLQATTTLPPGQRSAIPHSAVVAATTVQPPNASTAPEGTPAVAAAAATENELLLETIFARAWDRILVNIVDAAWGEFEELHDLHPDVLIWAANEWSIDTSGND
eukprot:GHVT01043447.1.p1 GENE.GHVT01043447.1~~GHVT01043447.1.p1  ORF type:complete len:220 (+),score=36.26 GHVT01043447.1:2712-3371(+)